MAGSVDYQQWVRAGKPATTMRPIADLCRVLRGHGYNVGRMDIPGLGDDRHLLDLTPEDHTPYSRSGWPVNPTPRWFVTAIDLMRVSDGLEVPAGKPSIRAVMEKLRADKIAGRPEVAWVKYINWTDAAGNCWQDSWRPTYRREPSVDRGHGHISGRSDMLNSAAAAHYDPIAELTKGDDMTEFGFSVAGMGNALAYRGDAMASGSKVVRGGPTVGEPHWLVATVAQISADVAAAKVTDAALKATIDGLVAAIHAGGGSVDTVPIIAAIRGVAAAESAAVTDLHDQIARLSEQLAAYRQAEADATRAGAGILDTARPDGKP